MQIDEVYSHLNGLEWLLVHRPALWEEIQAAVGAVDAATHKTKISREKGQVGRRLYSPPDINSAMKVTLSHAGWAEHRTSYWVTRDHSLIRRTMHMPPADQKREIEAAGETPIRSYNQTDFVKERVAVEVQLGKYAFIAYDLFVKHLAFYVSDAIDLRIEILPMKSMQSEMSSGPGYFEGALYDLVRQGRGVPAVPLVVIGIVP